jgi:hypothetical protein
MAQRLEDLLDIVGLQALETPVAGMGMNFTGTPNINYLQNLANLAQQQQGPQLGPDEFGSYVIPPSDPTYSSGFDYARSIAGGMPMSQVIAPGVSYSPEQPMGYTQEQLNIPKDMPAPPPPPRFIDRETDRDRFSINRLPGDLPDFAKLGIDFVPRPEGARPGILGNIDFANLPQKGFFSFDPENFKMLQNMGGAFDFDQDAIDKIVQERIAESMPTFEQPDLSQFVTKQDIPSFIPDIPTGREFSIEDIQQGLNLPDFSQFARQEDIPAPSVFDEEALRKELMEDIRGSINIPQMPDLSGLARLEDIPSFDPSVLKQDILMSIPQQQIPDVSKFVTQDDISKAIAGIDMPTYQAPDLSAYDTRLAQLEEQLAGFKQPTGGRFSVDQQLPMGLF